MGARRGQVECSKPLRPLLGTFQEGLTDLLGLQLGMVRAQQSHPSRGQRRRVGLTGHLGLAQVRADHLEFVPGRGQVGITAVGGFLDECTVLVGARHRDDVGIVLSDGGRCHDDRAGTDRVGRGLGQILVGLGDRDDLDPLLRGEPDRTFHVVHSRQGQKPRGGGHTEHTTLGVLTMPVPGDQGSHRRALARGITVVTEVGVDLEIVPQVGVIVVDRKTHQGDDDALPLRLLPQFRSTDGGRPPLLGAKVRATFAVRHRGRCRRTENGESHARGRDPTEPVAYVCAVSTVAPEHVRSPSHDAVDVPPGPPRPFVILPRAQDSGADKGPGSEGRQL